MSLTRPMTTDEIVRSSLGLTTIQVRLARILFTADTRMRLYRYLQTYVENGLRETDALAQIYNLVVQTSGFRTWDPLAVFSAQALHKLTQSGGTLSSFLAEWAPQNEASILAAGQETGLGPQLLEKLIHHSERLAEVTTIVRNAFASLGLGLFLSFAALYWIGAEIFPDLVRSIKTDTFYGYAGELKAMSDFMVNYGLWSGLALIAFVLLIVYSMPNLTGRVRRILDRVPPWSIYRDLSAATFLIGLATLIQKGVNEQNALVALNRQAKPYLREKISHLIRLDDRALPDRLASFSPPWPNLALVMDLSVFMGAKRPDEGIEICSGKLLDSLELRMKGVTSLVTTMAMVFIALLSFWIVAAVNDISKSVESQGPIATEEISTSDNQDLA